MAGSLLKSVCVSSPRLCCAYSALGLLLFLSPRPASPQSKGFEMGGSAATTGKRLALVIGNKDYAWKPLANPVNDATDVAAALERDGFKVSLATDLRFRDSSPALDMKSIVRQFVESVHKNDFAFVYYSGHGVEVRGTNYLLPIDLPADATSGAIKDESVSAQDLVNDLQDQGASVSVLVLDACRSNPINANGDRDFESRGLARMDPGHGTLVVFPTQAGRTASDNSVGRNGLFTQYLLPALARKGVRLDDAIRDAASQMVHDTGGMQTPALYGLLDNPVFLINGPVTVNVNPAQPEPDAALEAWNAIKDTHSPQDFDDFVAAFPQSPFATSARLAANRLRRETALSSPTPSNPAPSSPQFSESSNSTTAKAAADRGWSFYYQKDYLRAIPEFREACIGSDAASCRSVGFLYENGLGVTKEMGKAEQFYKQGCDLGDMESCKNLGHMYEYAEGVASDYTKSVALYRQACNGGNLGGCTNLGSMYHNAEGVAKDDYLAFKLFKQACDGHNVIGCVNLGTMYWLERSLPGHLEMARQLFDQACKDGNQSGCNDLMALDAK